MNPADTLAKQDIDDLYSVLGRIKQSKSTLYKEALARQGIDLCANELTRISKEANNAKCS
jgi:hypothetical protein